MSRRFANKVVLVTGGGSGIGAATAHRFAGEGATVVVVGRTEGKLKQTAAEAADGATIVARTADVADQSSVAALIDAVAGEFGRIDVLVNNAAIGLGGTVEQIDPADWRRTFAIDVDGVFHASRAALPWLREVGGCIVNVGSLSGLGGNWGLAAYNAAKGALVNLTNAMALDHAAEGVRVNAVHPSLTRTPLAGPILDSEPAVSAFTQRIPMRRIAEPEEVAAVIAFLASPDAGYLTGVHIPVDGGLTASNGQPRMF
ncbi:SDR family NAD(P)-dependent oxidoreductase [Nocardia panacis]|uniref:SDR family NAD(P)-dependent oxidoreductase n=1 Tax=Nocardia panacis TaxID=2340916 RepID=UPI0019398260|nr:SDR family oxidoreductase [Nocardia panacis]